MRWLDSSPSVQERQPRRPGGTAARPELRPLSPTPTSARWATTMDSSPTTLFDSYEQDFKQIVQSIRDKLDGDAKDGQGEQRKAALRRVEMELDEADEMVRSRS